MILDRFCILVDVHCKNQRRGCRWRQMRTTYIFTALLAFLSSCKKEIRCDTVGRDPFIVQYCESDENLSNVPFIDNATLSRNEIDQYDSIRVKFNFMDGDGDLGSYDASINIYGPPSEWSLYCGRCDLNCFDTSSLSQVFVLDIRTNCGNTFFIPEIYNTPVRGEISLIIISNDLCCILPNGIRCAPSTQYPADTVTFKIKLKDRAGNVSNEIETPPLIIRCN